MSTPAADTTLVNQAPSVPPPGGKSETERFETQQLLGKGGMGEVVQARDPRIDRDIALKTLLPMADEKLRLRFNREAQITGQLEHPNIPPVYEFGDTHDGRPYLALKLVRGETLTQIIERLRSGDEEAHREYGFTRRLQIVQQLCEAVHYAHSRGYLHRDIKPDNVMVGAFGEVLLMDWGLACKIERPAESVEPELTTEFTFLGTPTYAAPERFTGESGPASDQYAIAATAYTFFALTPPFQGTHTGQIVNAVMNGMPPSLESYNVPIQGRIAREISLLISRAMNKNADYRFKDVKELSPELQLVLDGEIHAVCPHTTAKLAMHRFGKALDNHNRWLMPLSLLWLAWPLGNIVWWIYEFASRHLSH